MDNFEKDIAAINSIPAVSTILDIVCRLTGMRFAAVARVTEERWIACQVKDDINFGLKAGGELELKSTICDEIRQSKSYVVIDHVANDDTYCLHHTPKQYGLQSYISIPIILKDGTFFGTLCAIDPQPAKINTPEIIGTFQLFAELIAFNLVTVDQLALTKAQLLEEKRVAELREQFIAVLGHDLRNPLSAISSGAEILTRLPLEKRGADVANMIANCSKRMAKLIENIMDFARGRLGSGITLDRTNDRPISTLIEHCVEEIRLFSPSSIIHVICNVENVINCDRHKVAQLLSNLLGNAVTHGDKSKPITVTAEEKNGMFELSVVNVGQPIPFDKLEKLFQPFARDEKQKEKQGLGLGLYIASQIAVAHEGKLSVISNNDETRFTFTMPIV